MVMIESTKRAANLGITKVTGTIKLGDPARQRMPHPKVSRLEGDLLTWAD
jgi:hypothetical protein